MPYPLIRRTRAAYTLLVVAAALWAGSPVAAQSAPGQFKVGDAVEGDYLGYYPGKVVEVLHGGQQYVLELRSPDDGKTFRYTLPAFKVRAPTAVSRRSAPRTQPPGAPLVGRYGCTQSVRSGGSYQTEMRGSVTLMADGRYRYVMGAPGRYRYDASTGATTFTGGFLDGATATDIDGKRHRLFITTLPSSGRGRWACSKVD